MRGGTADRIVFGVMNGDGSGQRQLGAVPGDGYFGPAGSPDSRTIAITRWDDSACTPTSRNCADSVLVLADTESGEERLVLRPGGRGAGDLLMECWARRQRARAVRLAA